MKLIFTFFSVLFTAVALYCQDLPTVDELTELVDGKTDADLVLYEGILDEYHQVKIALAFQGSDCTGYYEYLSSGLAFNLEGSIDDDNILHLIELDKNDQISAYLSGEYKKNGFNLVWKDVRKLNQLELRFNPIVTLDEVTSEPLKEALVKIKARTYGKELDIQIDKIESKIDVQGHNFPSFNFDLECGDNACQNMYASDLGSNNEYIGFSYEPFDEKKKTIIFEKKNKSKVLFVGDIQATIYEKHKTFADYRVLIDLSYPTTKSFEFNKWIELRVNATQKALIDEIYENILNDAGDIPEERFQYEAYSWYELDYISSEVISGTITHTKSWSNETDKIAFIFDSKNQKMLELSDMFKSSFDHLDYISSFVSEMKNDLSLGTEVPEKLDWIYQTAFDNISLDERGLICNSDYSVIFGDNEFVIPYDEVKEYFKNKTIKKEFTE